MTAFPPPRSVRVTPRLPSGAGTPIQLSLHEAGSGPAVVLCHGFPELAYSWRHQIAPLADAGFRVLAPDQRGYGDSDRPAATTDYDIHHLTGDLVGLLDAVGIERAVFVGHDWGGFVAWAMAILHPDRVAGVVGVNTPYTPRPAQPPTTLLRMLVGGQDERMYILWFQQPGAAEAVLDRQVRLVFEKLIRGGVDPAVAASRMLESGQLDMNPFRRLPEIESLGEPVLSPEEMEVFIATFERTGFGGGIQWYRNFDRNWELAPDVGVAKVEAPSLMVCAEWDPVLRPEMAAGMPPLVPDLEMVTLPRCGHWTQQEQPEALNRVLVDWLRRRFLA